MNPGRQSRSITCGPRLLSIQLPAAPALTASSVFCRSRPPAWAKSSASLDAEHGDDDQDLVDQFDRLAGGRAADMGDRLAHGLQGGHGAFHLRRIAADHDAQRAFGRAFAAAADRRIEHADPFSGQGRGDIARGLGADGAHIDHQAARFGAVDDAIFAEDDRLHVRRIADAGDDDIAFCSDICRAAAAVGAGRDDGIHAAGGAVPNVEREAGLQQVAGHAFAHDAEADEADGFVHLLFSIIDVWSS